MNTAALRRQLAAAIRTAEREREKAEKAQLGRSASMAEGEIRMARRVLGWLDESEAE